VIRPEVAEKTKALAKKTKAAKKAAVEEASDCLAESAQEMVRKKLIAMANTLEPKAPKALMAEFGFSKVSAIPNDPELVARFVATIDKAMEEAQNDA